jgi:small-conductance mechanosensitive channel
LKPQKEYSFMRSFKNLILPISLTLIFFSLKPLIHFYWANPNPLLSFIAQYSNILVILSFSWALISLLKALKKILLEQYDISLEDNLESRKVHTQINILERVVIFLIVLFTIGLILLSFERIREIGIGLFASAGLASVIIGLSAQKVVGALLAGIQIAFTQPFRLDDAVVVENEWGWIEEINLTYVVIRLWDKRRLVLPSTYFLDKPFQNWTRTSAEIIGSVFIHTDYTIPFPELREELSRLLNETDLWDGKVKVLQVTDAKANTVEIRMLMSAKNSPTAWDLRVYVREKMIEFIQKNYPESLPKTRVMMESETRVSPS